MRCRCCDKNLDDAESTKKHPERNEYLDLCRRCEAIIDDDLNFEDDIIETPDERLEYDEDFAPEE
jgi:hypothetical protein